MLFRSGTPVPLSYEEIRKRLFLLSFDPYHCIERRWGASQPAELSTCRDDTTKAAWYAAQQGYRNQIDRTYDARMDFTLAELQGPISPGKGVALPADIDVKGYLLLVAQRQVRAPSRPPISPASPAPGLGARPAQR